ncbi:MAG TPA: UvrD-helicase domain-containing protein [Trebonia sp.]|nr:UvrD-helicase domain-containing protein [Trebonia sp.]
MSMVLNSEQRAIVKASKTARTMRVVALAGTGKTSTLAEVAEANPYVQYLYVAYNKAAQLDAAARFPRNVKCQTSHGMVFMQYGKRYSSKLNAPRVPAWKAAKVLGLAELRVEYCVSCSMVTSEGGDHAGHAVLAETVNTTAMASLVMRGVDRWCHSDQAEIDWWHIPPVKGADERLQRAIRESLVSSAREAWKDLKSANGQLKFSHDMYLKMAQLDGWRTDRNSVMLDEAQDTNPCVASMLLSAKGKRMTMVGDPNQAIYEWRGATDAMDKFEADETLGLTGSYRFGPEIAEFANEWLGMLGSEMQLKGWKKLEGKVVDFVEEPDAILCRSNGGCVAAAMHWLEAGRKVAVVGGGGEIESLARGAQGLMAGRRSEHPDLVNFDSWGAVQAYCKEEPEAAGTLVPLVRAISQYGPEAIMTMARSLVPEDRADVTVSTQHRSKGRQWKTVQIAGDVMQPKAGEELPREELRLSYVAATRAQDVLATGGDGGLGWIKGGLAT